MSILIKNANILTLDPQDRTYPTADLLIKNDRIEAIGVSLSDSGVDEVIDARGKLAMPGLNVAHAHSFAQLFKGVFDGLPLDIWILDTNAPPLGWMVSPRQLYLRTMLGAIELIRSGATMIWDDLLATEDKNEGVFSAYSDVGIRAMVTATMYDKRLPDRTVFLRKSLPAELLEPLLQERRRSVNEWMELSQTIMDRWHGFDGRLSFGVSVAWPQGCSDDLMVEAADFAYRYNLPYMTHVLETKVQQVTGEVFYGKTIVQRLHDLGVLSPRASIMHGIWVTDEDIDLLARSQTTVVHNPVSNLILGSGLIPMRKMMEAGVNIALGVDEGVQTRWNPFEMMRVASLMQKVSEPDAQRWVNSSEILRMATLGGARSELLQAEIGSLEAGKKADVILIDLNQKPYIPLHDLKKQLVYNESGASVETSIVNGKIVMRDRRILTVDEAALLEEARQMMTDYWKIHEERNTLEFPRKVKPVVEKIYKDIAATPTGLNRWLGNEEEWVK